MQEGRSRTRSLPWVLNPLPILILPHWKVLHMYFRNCPSFCPSPWWKQDLLADFPHLLPEDKESSTDDNYSWHEDFQDQWFAEYSVCNTPGWLFDGIPINWLHSQAATKRSRGVCLVKADYPRLLLLIKQNGSGGCDTSEHSGSVLRGLDNIPNLSATPVPKVFILDQGMHHISIPEGELVWNWGKKISSMLWK